MENVVKFDINSYIDNGAFCPIDADEDTKEKFLRSIGVHHFDSSPKVNANLTAKHILKHTNIIPLDNYNLAIYNGKFFEIKDAQYIINYIIKKILNCVGNYWNTRREIEINEALKRSFDYKILSMDTQNVINLNNGVLSLDDFKLSKHSPNYYSSNVLNTKYDKNAGCPKWLAFLNQTFMGDKSLINLLQEVFGMCISNVNVGKCAIFYGSGMNGKSVVADILKSLVGENCVSHLSLERFQSQFGLQSLIGKRLNIASELETGDFNLLTANFKAIVTGDPVHVDIKYKDPLEMVMNCKLVFLTNNLPETLDSSHGFLRRLLILPFNNTVKEKDKDIHLAEKLKGELSGILNWAIEGLRRLESNNHIFTECKAAAECLNKYKKQLNDVGDFFDECFIKQENTKIKKADIYSFYSIYCNVNGNSNISKREFWKKLNSSLTNKNISLDIRKINGVDYIYGYSKNKEIQFDIPTVGTTPNNEFAVNFQ